eukprot:TRINITY_DN3767_c0_g1_i1.p1 TRINITY_DN3767_c0_g1~~TRINITY_DN3767_c0_g1_i1.p1  ORF type:complete len:472 (-),score=275.42 TRINITY_DN3767_c0_g1_i1:26-1441(-)
MSEKEPLIGAGATGGKKPPSRPFKFFVLLVISLICFGPYFAYDSIQNVSVQMKEQIGITDTKFGVLYAVYSFPNMILPFFGGVAGDRLGLRAASMLFVSFVVIGAVLVALAPLKQFGLSDNTIFLGMAIGRTLFGAGAESLNVTQIAMVSEWFREGKEMAMAFALVLSVSRLGDFLALFLGGRIADYFGSFQSTLIAAAGLCILSFLCSALYFAVDKWSERRYYRPKPEPAPFGWENFKCVTRFELRFWLISLLCMTYYAGVMPFVSMLGGWLQNKYGYDQTSAGSLSSVVTLASMVLSPFLGKAVDVVGRRPLVVALGSLLILPAHLALTITGPSFAFTIFPLWPIVAVGLSFSLVPASLWPCVPLVIAEENTATAFGVMTAIQNCGLFLVNIVVNYIREHYGDESAMMFFVCADALGLLGALVLYVVDQRRGGTLCLIKSDELVVPPEITDAMPDYTNPFDDKESKVAH